MQMILATVQTPLKSRSAVEPVGNLSKMISAERLGLGVLSALSGTITSAKILQRTFLCLTLNVKIVIP